MNEVINCPKCNNPIEVSAAMSAQLSDRIRREVESDLAGQRRELTDRVKQLEHKERGLNEARGEIEERIKEEVTRQRNSILAEAKKKAAEEIAVELKDREDRLGELQAKLKAAQQNELNLRKKERELQSRAEELELDVNRRLDAERANIRKQVLEQSACDHQFKMAEKEKLITDLKRKIDEMKQKAEQGSQQAQGEVQEIALEQLLLERFPGDSFDPVPKGIRGADVLQRVIDSSGSDCGTILWESKRTRNWSDGWLSKARDDQRAAKANCVVIVSQVLPAGVQHFDLVDGVWVCGWEYAASAAVALRSGAIDAAKHIRAQQGKNGKMELVYSYLAGPEFRNRVSGIAEPFIEMQTDLARERRAAQKTWTKRELPPFGRTRGTN